MRFGKDIIGNEKLKELNDNGLDVFDVKILDEIKGLSQIIDSQKLTHNVLIDRVNALSKCCEMLLRCQDKPTRTYVRNILDKNEGKK